MMYKVFAIVASLGIGLVGTYPGGVQQLNLDVSTCASIRLCEFYDGSLNLNSIDPSVLFIRRM